MNENQIADIWMLFKEYVDKKVQDTVAEHYVAMLSDHGVDDKHLEAAMGFDNVLDIAIGYFLDDEEEEEEDVESDWED